MQRWDTVDMTTRSFKPSSLSLRPRRPSISRTSSAGSTKSQERPLSQDSFIEGYFNFRIAATPSPGKRTPPVNFGQAQHHQNCQSYQHQPPQSQSQSQCQYPSPSQLQSQTSQTQMQMQTQLLVDSPRLARSRPITIEMPTRKGSVVHTPPPNDPLSARGDLQGGYFPLHEDFKRSYITHPFNAHLKIPSEKLRKNRSDSSLTSTNPSPSYILSSPNAHNQPQPPTESFGSNQTMDPVTNAISTSISMGKYHPSNYKNKNNSSTASSNSHSAVTTASVTSPVLSRHARKSPDIQKKLQQYQRDMVEQAAILARMKVPGGMSKPSSPRLVPLGSPGPVTPWELEGGDEGYIVAGMAARTGGSNYGVEVGGLQDVQAAVGRLIGSEVEEARAVEARR